MAKKSEWEERFRTIKEKFPSVENLDLTESLEKDPDAFTQMMGDLIKAGGKRQRPGKRPPLDRALAEEELSKLMQEDYTDHSFPVAFRALAGTRSMRGLAAKTGCNKDYIVRYLKGTLMPSFGDMEKIARAFNKEPEFFIEYRIAFILLVIDQYLQDNPERATIWHRRLRVQKKIKVM